MGVINSATSIYASIPIFSILGFKATTAFNACKDEYVSMPILGGVLQLRLFLILSTYSSNLICRNILALTNYFEFSDQNITLQNYDYWYEYLNTTYPEKFQSLSLRECDLQKLLKQVLTPSYSHSSILEPLIHKHWSFSDIAISSILISFLFFLSSECFRYWPGFYRVH